MLTGRSALLTALFTPAIIRSPGILMPISPPKAGITTEVPAMLGEIVKILEYDVSAGKFIWRLPTSHESGSIQILGL
jgi:hypothetical protein